MTQITPISPNLAKLPQTYANAKVALFNCVTVDECQSWADKAAALASYAKQARDEELMKMATRIKARAIRRAGELLKQIVPRQGANQNISGGTPTKVATRKDAARVAGMSRDQMHAALRTASVPSVQFEALVESQTPPTVTTLAALGINRAPAGVMPGRSGADFNKAMHFMAGFEEYARTVEAMDLGEMLPNLAPKEAVRVKRIISRIDAVHDKIMTRI